MSRLPARVLLPSGDRPAPTEAGAETGAAAERHWRSLAPRHASRAEASTPVTTKKERQATACLSFLAGAEGLGLRSRSGRLAAERHWRSLAPRHAVLEWMWESALGERGRGSVARFPTQVRGRTVLVWCYGKFSGPKRAKKSGKSPKKREILLTKTDTVPIL